MRIIFKCTLVFFAMAILGIDPIYYEGLMDVHLINFAKTVANASMYSMYLSVVFIWIKTIGDLQGKLPDTFRRVEAILQGILLSSFGIIFLASLIWFKMPQWIFNFLTNSVMMLFELSFSVGNLTFGLDVFCTFRATYNATKSAKTKEVTSRTRSTLSRIFCLIFTGVSLAIVISILHFSALTKYLVNKYGFYPGDNKEPIAASSSDLLNMFGMYYIANIVVIVVCLSFRKMPDPESATKHPATPSNRKNSTTTPTNRKNSRARGNSERSHNGSSAHAGGTEGEAHLAIVPTFGKEKPADMTPINLEEGGNQQLMSSSLGVETLNSMKIEPLSPINMAKDAEANGT